MTSLQSQMQWRTRIQWALGGALVLGAIAFYLVAYRPAAARLESLRIEMQSKEAELAQNSNRTSTMEYLAREVGKLEAKAQEYDRQFPRQVELGRFIKDLTQVSQELSLQDWKYEPLSPRRGESYFELPITMHFNGDFLNATAFLRRMQDMQRLTHVKKIDMTAKDNKAGTVHVEMTMSIYFSEG